MKTIRNGSRGDDVKVLQRRLNLLDDGIFGVLTEEAVKEFQRAHGLTQDGIVGQQTWQALGVYSPVDVKKSKRSINEIIVHCTATPQGRNVTVAEITQWHKQRGFTTIGYHYVIYIDGSLHIGRDIDVAGAHCTGHNTHSIGVCYVGGLAKDGKTPLDTRTDAQKKALVDLLKRLRSIYRNASIRGHRDFAPKACPSFDATKEYKYL